MIAINFDFTILLNKFNRKRKFPLFEWLWSVCLACQIFRNTKVKWICISLIIINMIIIKNKFVFDLMIFV